MKENWKLAAAVTLLLSGMASSNAEAQDQAQAKSARAGGSADIEARLEYRHMPRDEENEIIWGYKKSNGPDKWAELDPEFHLCADGLEQAPIDIDSANVTSEDLPDIKFFYESTPVHILNNGRTVEVEYEPGSFIELGGESYELKQFHFHSISEHTVSLGAHFPIEMHLVHVNTNPDSETPVAVVTAFIREGEENETLRETWYYLPPHEGYEYTLPFDINIEEALPTDRRTYRYKGSFTTPPCTEGVRFLIFKQPIEMSKKQIKHFRKVLRKSCCHNNNRPTQPLNGRQIFFDTTQEELPENNQ